MLGAYPNVTLSEARKRARRILNAASEGKDIPAVQREKSRKPVFAKIAEQYLEKHAKANKRNWKEDARLIHKELLPVWRRKRPQDIKRKDVIALLDGIVERGAPIQANRVHALISKIFNWAIERELVEYNPSSNVKKLAKENQRERVLSDEEIGALWAAFKQQSATIGSMFMLRLLTAQRGGEIASMAWKDFDLQNSWWTNPGEITKNGRSHRVPLTPHAVKLLTQLQATTGNQRWVFPSPSIEGQHITNVQKAAIRVKELSGVGDFVLHDLRRTAASYMASLGVGTDVISKILNHVESGVTAVYNRHSYDPEKRDALERWERHLLGIVSVSGQQTSDSGLAARAQEWRVPHEGDQQIER